MSEAKNYELHIDDLTFTEAKSLYAHLIGVPYPEICDGSGDSFAGSLKLGSSGCLVSIRPSPKHCCGCDGKRAFSRYPDGILVPCNICHEPSERK